MSVINAVTESGESSESSQNAGDLLANLVGEGKKYKDVNALVASRLEADRHIEQLERENASMRADMAANDNKKAEQKTLTDILAAIEKAKGAEGSNQPAPTQEELTKLIRSTLSQTKQEETRATNRELVDQSLIAKFGTVEAAKQKVIERSRELGLTPGVIKELSETTPAAFLELFGVTSNNNSVNSQKPVVKGNVNPESINLVPDNGERKYAYYKALRQKMGRNAFYADTNVQYQMSKDMAKYGESFMS